jgi:hypothetical protein
MRYHGEFADGGIEVPMRQPQLLELGVVAESIIYSVVHDVSWASPRQV